MRELLNRIENKPPEIVVEWHDSHTPAKGRGVINSLRGGAAGKVVEDPRYTPDPTRKYLVHT